MQNIPKEKVRQQSGKITTLHRKVETLKRLHYTIDNRPITGDAPKNFLYVYEFRNGKCRRNDVKTWIPYIAKVGHKWYPSESVTEYLMNQIGEVLGLSMAKSRLAIVNGQLRFMSRYFLKEDELLVHGAELFSNYLCDPDMVEEIGIRKDEQSYFTFQFVEAAIKTTFPEQAEQFLCSFVRLLVFDALTGNNDRHHYNWGIISDIREDKNTVRFSPIYDTARGLFWSTSDEIIDKWLNNTQLLTSKIVNYAQNAKPQTGWEGKGNINHFRLIELLWQDGRFKNIISEMCDVRNIPKIFRLIDSEFNFLTTQGRRILIKKCLQLRFDTLNKIITQ